MRQSSRALRLAHLALLPVFMFLVGCPWGANDSPKPAATPTTSASPPEIRFEHSDIGQVVPSDPERFVESAEWGTVPANLLGIRISEQGGRRSAENAAAAIDGEIVGEVRTLRLYQIQTAGNTADDLTDAIQKVREQPDVELAFPLQPIEEFSCCDILEDPVYEGARSEGYRIIGIEDAWTFLKAARAMGLDLSQAIAGVADSPIYVAPGDTAHEFRAVDLVTPFPQDRTDQPQRDSAGNLKYGNSTHGTQVSHLIAADPDNGGVAGVAGVLGKELRIVHMTHNDSTGGVNPLQAVFVVEELIRRGAKIVNMSWGLKNPAPDVLATLRDMVTSHPEVLFIAAAGNDKLPLNGANLAPGGLSLANLVTVASVGNDRVWDNVTNRFGTGGEITLAAPGDRAVRDVTPGGKVVDIKGGTSMATPQVTAAAALALAVDPTLTAAELKTLLVDAAEPGGITLEQLRKRHAGDVPPPSEADLQRARAAASRDLPKILRVDRVVFRAIDRRLAREGKPAVTVETLRGFCRVELTTTGSTAPFEVRAKLPAVGPEGTDVEIEIIGGKAGIAGSTRPHIGDAGDEAVWQVSPPDEVDKVTVVVTRLDTGAEARLELEVKPEPVGVKTVWSLSHLDLKVPIPGQSGKWDVQRIEAKPTVSIEASGKARNDSYTLTAEVTVPDEFHFGDLVPRKGLQIPAFLRDAAKFHVQLKGESTAAGRMSMHARIRTPHPLFPTIKEGRSSRDDGARLETKVFPTSAQRAFLQPWMRLRKPQTAVPLQEHTVALSISHNPNGDLQQLDLESGFEVPAGSGYFRDGIPTRRGFSEAYDDKPGEMVVVVYLQGGSAGGSARRELRFHYLRED